MKKDHIFIQCAGYRDPELKNTIRTAIQNAANPDQMVFGICWQGKFRELKEQLYVRELKKCRTVLIDMDASQGIGYARHKAQQMYEGEQYVLQIDSHMKFLPNWDKMCIRLLDRCPSEKPLLSAYLTCYQAEEEPGCYRLGASDFAKNGNLTIVGMSVIKGKKPELGFLCSGHFVFSEAELYDEVPVDPYLQFLYEETLIAPRAWTNGWDIFYPHKAPMQHRWGRAYRNTNWDDLDVKKQVRACAKRYREILEIIPQTEDYGRYGMGNARTLKEYERFSGLNFRDLTISRKAKKGYPTNPY